MKRNSSERKITPTLASLIIGNVITYYIHVYVKRLNNILDRSALALHLT